MAAFGGSRAIEIALRLSAHTSAASHAIDQFASRTAARMEAMNKFGDKMMSSGKSNLMQGAAIAAPILLATKAAADLEDKVADVAKVTNVAFGSKEFAGLEDSAMRVGEFLGRSSDEAADLMAQLAAGGVAQNRLESVAKSAGKIGVAFDVSAGEAGKAYMMIQNAMGLTEEQTMHVMDAMNAATNKFGGQASELLNFMANGGASVARTLKISGSDMQAFANSLQVVGVSSSEAATTMERFQQAVLVKPKLAAMYKAAGGGTAGLLSILERAQKSGNATTWLLTNGVGQYSTKIAQLSQNLGGSKGLLSQLKYLRNEENVNGSATQEFNNRQQTTVEQFNKLKVSAMDLAVKLGTTMIPVIRSLLEQVKPLISSISSWIKLHPQLAANIMKGIAIFAVAKMGIGGLQIGIGSVIKVVAKTIDILPNVINGINMFGSVFLFIGRMMLTNPIGLTITAIGVAALLIYKYWGPIKGFFARLWSGVKTAFFAVKKFIVSSFLMFSPLGLLLKNWGPISNMFSHLWDGVKAIFNGFVDWIKNTWVGKAFNVVANGWQKIKSFFGGSSPNTPTSPVVGSPIGPRTSPVRAGGGTSLHYSPTITVSGSATKADANRIAQASEQGFNKAMQRWQDQKRRTSFGMG